MKKQWGRALSLVLVLAMLASVLPTAVFAEVTTEKTICISGETTGNPNEYTVSGQSLMIGMEKEGSFQFATAYTSSGSFLKTYTLTDPVTVEDGETYTMSTDTVYYVSGSTSRTIPTSFQIVIKDASKVTLNSDPGTYTFKEGDGAKAEDILALVVDFTLPANANLTLQYNASNSGTSWQSVSYSPSGLSQLSQHKFGDHTTEKIRVSFAGDDFYAPSRAEMEIAVEKLTAVNATCSVASGSPAGADVNFTPSNTKSVPLYPGDTAAVTVVPVTGYKYTLTQGSVVKTQDELTNDRYTFSRGTDQTRIDEIVVKYSWDAVNITPNALGTITANANADGTMFTITVTPTEGNAVVSVSANGTEYTPYSATPLTFSQTGGAATVTVPVAGAMNTVSAVIKPELTVNEPATVDYYPGMAAPTDADVFAQVADADNSVLTADKVTVTYLAGEIEGLASTISVYLPIGWSGDTAAIQNALTTVEKLGLNTKYLGKYSDLYAGLAEDFLHTFGESESGETISISYKRSNYAQCAFNVEKTVFVSFVDPRRETETTLGMSRYTMPYGNTAADNAVLSAAAVRDKTTGNPVPANTSDLKLVLFSDGNGVTTCESIDTLSTLNVGSYQIGVKYCGSGDYGASVSAPITLTVSRANADISIDSKRVTYPVYDETTESYLYDFAPETTPDGVNNFMILIGIDGDGKGFVDLKLDDDLISRLRSYGISGENQIIQGISDWLNNLGGNTGWLDGIIGTVSQANAYDILRNMINGRNIFQLGEILNNDLVRGILENVMGSSPDLSGVAQIMDMIGDNIDFECIVYLDELPKEAGLYGALAATVDSNYSTDVAVGYLIIEPNTEDVAIDWNEEVRIVRISDVPSTDFGAYSYYKADDGKTPIDELPPKIWYLGVTADPDDENHIYFSQTPPDFTGAYTEAAYIFGNYLAYNVRAFVVAPNESRICFVDENGQYVTSNTVTVVYDGQPHAMPAVVLDENDHVVADADVYYVGLETNISVYSSSDAPVDAGAYKVVATYLGNGEYMPNLSLEGTLIIEMVPTSIQFAAEDGGEEDYSDRFLAIYTYDGNTHGVITQLVDGDDNVLADESGKINVVYLYTDEEHAGVTLDKPRDAGLYSAVATYQGDRNHRPALNVLASIVIRKAPDATITYNDFETVYGESFDLLEHIGIDGLIESEKQAVLATAACSDDVHNAGQHEFSVEYSQFVKNYRSVTTNQPVGIHTVLKAPQDAPVAPAPETVGQTFIELYPISAAPGVIVEYAISTTDTAPDADSDAWTVSTTFTGLDPDTEYYFFARLAGDANHFPSPASEVSAIRTVAEPEPCVFEYPEYYPSFTFPIGYWLTVGNTTSDNDTIEPISSGAAEDISVIENNNFRKECPRDETCPLDRFTDMDNNGWYHDGVHYCLETGLMKGVAENLFDPLGDTSRAMVVTMLWRLEGYPVVNYSMSFTDVAADTWYTEAVRWAASEDIVEGYDAETFGPDDPVTREQLATILYAYAKSKGDGFTGAWAFPLNFTDAASVSSWADEAMHWCVMKGIVNGSDGKLEPQNNASRAETAAMFQRFCEADK